MPERFSSLQNAIQGNYAFPLKELCHLDFFAFKAFQNNQKGNAENQLRTNTVYCQGWALVKFLNEFGEGRYQGQFREYFRAEVLGQGGGEKFGEIFALESDDDWADFEQEFVDWVFTDLRSQKRKK
jgi:hypothetical protein